MKKKRSRRDLAKERFWRGTLREQANSGQSVRAFCRERQLTEAAFYFWRRELKQRESQKQLPQAGRLTTDVEKKPDAKGSVLALLLQGIDLKVTRRRKRYRRPT